MTLEQRVTALEREGTDDIERWEAVHKRISGVGTALFITLCAIQETQPAAFAKIIGRLQLVEKDWRAKNEHAAAIDEIHRLLHALTMALDPIQPSMPKDRRKP